ncbi:MAG TPA: hypothetical protein VF735_15065 [Pyrinomonadaceae bacterium]
MNRTASTTNITVSTTTAKPASKYEIKQRIEVDAFGRKRTAEYVKGIRI